MKKSLLLLGTCIFLAACTVHTDVKEAVKENLERAETALASIEDSVDHNSGARIIETDEVWLGDIGIQREHGEPFPSRFDYITISYDEPMTLEEITTHITAETGYSFTIFDNDDEENDDDIEEVGPRIIPPSLALNNQNQAPPVDLRDRMVLDHTGSFSDLVNLIAGRFGFDWINENQKVTFFKDQTIVYEIMSLPGQQSIQGALTTSTSPQGGSEQGSSFQAGINTSTQYTANVNFWDDLEATVKTQVGERGVVHVNQSTSSVTVRAHRQIQKKVKKFIDRLNADIEKVAIVEVQILKVTIEDEERFGLAMQGYFNDPASDFSFGANSSLPSSFVDGAGGRMGFEVVNPANRWVGSNGIIEMLGTTGSVSREDTALIVTQNHFSTPFQSVVLDTYLAAITENAVADNRTSETLSPGSYTVGLTLNLMVNIKPNSKMLVQLDYTASAREELRVFGSGNSNSVVQQPKIASTSSTMRSVMRPGETLVLTGLSRVANNLAKKVAGPLGFSSSADKNREVMIVLMTPRVKKT